MKTPDSHRAPAIFVGHGSPMNALEKNEYTEDLRVWSKSHPRPHSILVISAHWLTQGTFVSCQPNPRQIYDFYGFPEALYSMKYPCPGDPKLAKKIEGSLRTGFEKWSKENAGWAIVDGGCSEKWGIDHAAWAVLAHLYPEADIPVVELSLDMSKPPEYHYELGRSLRALRQENVLILGSGNLVHNLSLISWEEKAEPPRWALEMDEELKALLLARDHSRLTAYPYEGAHAGLGIPTQDHYLPLLYILGLQEKDEKVKFIHEGMQNATVSMRCLELA